MTYLRSFFLNFLMVFFIDRISPGIEIVYFDQVPNVGADILFSILVGFFNASVFPFLAILELKITKLKLAVMTGVISFAAFTIIAVIPFGVRVVSPLGFFFGSLVIWGVGYFSNYLEWTHIRDRG
ncbi:MAG: phage holin family protein [Chlamydiia bacterium]|nr:phage holin family protein [Chlamydiia bacterium]